MMRETLIAIGSLLSPAYRLRPQSGVSLPDRFCLMTRLLLMPDRQTACPCRSVTPVHLLDALSGPASAGCDGVTGFARCRLLQRWVRCRASPKSARLICDHAAHRIARCQARLCNGADRHSAKRPLVLVPVPRPIGKADRSDFFRSGLALMLHLAGTGTASAERIAAVFDLMIRGSTSRFSAALRLAAVETRGTTAAWKWP